MLTIPLWWLWCWLLSLLIAWVQIRPYNLTDGITRGFFYEKGIFLKNQQMTKQHTKLRSMQWLRCMHSEMSYFGLHYIIHFNILCVPTMTAKWRLCLSESLQANFMMHVLFWWPDSIGLNNGSKDVLCTTWLDNIILYRLKLILNWIRLINVQWVWCILLLKAM